MKCALKNKPAKKSIRENLVLKRRAKLSEEVIQEGGTRLKLKSSPIEIQLGINYSSNGRIVIHYPGFMETVDGYCNKYKNLASFLQEKELGAVIRMDNFERDYHSYEDTLNDDLRSVIEYALKNSRDICGKDNPELYLMGFSAGTQAIGAVSHKYPVKKILLMGPGLALDYFHELKEGLEKFSGEVYIVQGQNDKHLGEGRAFYNWATGARKKDMKVIPDCDHRFSHEINDMIYSKAPFWAFCHDTSFPNPEGGIRLVQKQA